MLHAPPPRRGSSCVRRGRTRRRAAVGFERLEGRVVLSTGTLVAEGAYPSLSGNLIAFQTTEQALQRDVDGDGAFSRRVVAYHDVATGVTTPVAVGGSQSFGASPSLSGNTLAFAMTEAETGRDVDGDGQLIRADILVYHDIATGVTTPVAWSSNFVASGGRIAYNTSERALQQDVDGDGAIETVQAVVAYFDVATGETTPVSGFGQVAAFSGSLLAFSASEADLQQDVTNDGTLNQYGLAVFDLVSGTTTAIPRSGALQANQRAAISGDRIAFVTSEQFLQQDVDGDGLISREVVCYHDLSAGATIVVGVGFEPSISEDRVAFRIPESWVQRDANGDGTYDQIALAVRDLAAGTTTYLDAIAGRPSISGSLVAYTTVISRTPVDEDGDGFPEYELEVYGVAYIDAIAPKTILADVSSQVISLGASGALTTGQVGSMNGKLHAARAALERDNLKAASHQIAAVIHQIRAILHRKGTAPETAAALAALEAELELLLGLL